VTEHETYGAFGSAADTLGGDAAPVRDEGPAYAESPLWDYHKAGRINGVPVVDADRGLKIDDETLLAAAFVLDRKPESLLLHMSPDRPENNEQYVRILDMAARGEAEIVDELRQWCPETASFVLWLRYNTLSYRLHPRFSYIREE